MSYKASLKSTSGARQLFMRAHKQIVAYLHFSQALPAWSAWQAAQPDLAPQAAHCCVWRFSADARCGRYQCMAVSAVQRLEMLPATSQTSSTIMSLRRRSNQLYAICACAGAALVQNAIITDQVGQSRQSRYRAHLRCLPRPLAALRPAGR